MGMDKNLLLACATIASLSTATIGLVSGARADDQLPETVPKATALEAADLLPITPFYTTPGKGEVYPGALIRFEKATDYTLPPHVSAYRILYHSLSATRQDVVSSAFVLIPDGPVPTSGWPVVAWAHGTSGVAQACAPSRMKDLYYGSEGLFKFPQAGLAVVATDYHGLGTVGPHQYMNKVAQAYDVIYSVMAAKAALPQLGADWVVDGHSQGGMASWSVAEMEQQINDPHFLGTVSVSGTINMLDFIHPRREEGGAPFYLPMVAVGLTARYPDYKPQSMLTPVGMEHYDVVASKGCWFVDYASYFGKSGDQITRDGWVRNPDVQAMLKEDEIGKLKVKGPLFVITGGGDVSVPPGGVRDVARAACHNGISLAFRLYPGLDHDPTMANSTDDQITWIKDRFNGKPLSSDCGKF
ncbi:lipase family protein [Komagataeibacter sp. FXV3]|uniref:lipase family protein n=1 Tax=Komagataeibacter sp. FXV3 TaxID=2608998 RepID=UPI001D12AAAA|nr:lipase family protein [Komagataeibacter sp. FXV3]